MARAFAFVNPFSCAGATGPCNTTSDSGCSSRRQSSRVIGQIWDRVRAGYGPYWFRSAQELTSADSCVGLASGTVSESRVDGFQRADLSVRIGRDHLLDGRLARSHLSGDDVVREVKLHLHVVDSRASKEESSGAQKRSSLVPGRSVAQRRSASSGRSCSSRTADLEIRAG